MGIIGKIIGGTIGFALGGPLGAVAGAVFGHAFDNEDDAVQQAPRASSLSSLQESQLAFFVGTFSMLAKLVTSDGKVSRDEIVAVENFAATDLALSPADRKVALNIFHTAMNSPARFEDFAIQFYSHFQYQPQMLEMMVDILLRVGIADGAIAVAEEALILSAVRIFNFSTSRYEQLKSKYVHTPDHVYGVLGCKPADTMDAIKRRYRHLVHTYHPDKIAGKGLPDEFTQLAEDKFREIQSAYEMIKKERGVP
jgi:DnaJ like chaperone protein